MTIYLKTKLTIANKDKAKKNRCTGERHFPNCELSRALALFGGVKTFSEQKLSELEALGLEVSFDEPEPTEEPESALPDWLGLVDCSEPSEHEESFRETFEKAYDLNFAWLARLSMD